MSQPSQGISMFFFCETQISITVFTIPVTCPNPEPHDPSLSTSTLLFKDPS
jgi:hypothetical protein